MTMIKLIQNEWIKIIKRPGTLVMIGLVIILVGVIGGFTKYSDGKSQQITDDKWKQVLQQETDGLKKDLKEASKNDPYKKSIEKNIAINEYRIKHNISPIEERNVWTFIDSTSDVIVLVGLFTIIIAANIVASEFNWGTIKLLLIRPYSRSKIILSKYLTSILFGLVFLTVLFIASLVIGLILFGPAEGNPSYLAYVDGHVEEQSRLLYSAKLYLLSFIETFMLATMAFMVSTIFRNNTIAIGLSIFLLFMGNVITTIVASKYEWAKYLLFANTNLMQYTDGVPIVEGMTMLFSCIVLICYLVIFLFLSFYVFSKRDVTA